MLKIGITGGMGSGKSIICRIFQMLGAPVYDADSRARLLMDKDEVLREKITLAFGAGAYCSDGTLNRGYLAEAVFPEKEKLEQLNKLVHPAVKKDFEEWAEKQKSDYVIKEAALLVETGSFKELDKLIVVTAPEKTRIHRILFRDAHRSQKQIQEILQNQFPESEKAKYADYLINNDESQLVFPQVLKIHARLTSATEGIKST